MKTTEKLVLKEVVTNLRKSTETNWTRGDSEDWNIWARSMKTVISTSVRIIDSLISEENKSENEEEIVDTNITINELLSMPGEEKERMITKFSKIIEILEA
jgi:hypothetical protein